MLTIAEPKVHSNGLMELELADTVSGGLLRGSLMTNLRAKTASNCKRGADADSCGMIIFARTSKPLSARYALVQACDTL